VCAPALRQEEGRSRQTNHFLNETSIMRILFLFLAVHTSLLLSAQKMKSALDAYFSQLAASNQFNGSILVAEKGKIIYERSFGYANFEKGQKLNAQTLFPIASISKTFAATALMQQVEKNRIDPEAPVNRYLTWFPYEQVTIRHLLSHTSGLPAYNAFFDSLRLAQPETRWINRDLQTAMALKTLPLLYAPGTKGNYDNINFLVMALVLERVSGLPFPELLEQEVLKPAGMKQTRFYPAFQQYDSRGRIAFALPYLFPHSYSDSLVPAQQVSFIRNYWNAYRLTGFGDYLSTTHDLLRYSEAYASGILLSKEAQKRMFRPVTLADGSGRPWQFGLGWEIGRDSSYGNVVYHNGNATGLSCVLIRNLTRHQTVIVVDNIHVNNAQALGFTALSILNGRPAPAVRSSLAARYGRILVQQGPAAARDSLFRLKADTARYYLSEDELNTLGYDLMGGVNHPNPYRFPEVRRYNDALEVFRLNTELFPLSWNAYDSYGEILMTVGRKEEAIRMYERSLELNPGNEGGKKMLRQLRGR
jgi:CubicO group peptidase (beta-lactamase class C family)